MEPVTVQVVVTVHKVEPLNDDRRMIMFPTTIIDYEHIRYVRPFYLLLLFVIPLCYVLLLQQRPQQPRQSTTATTTTTTTSSSSTSTTVAPPDSKENESAGTRPSMTSSTSNRNSDNRKDNDDMILPPIETKIAYEKDQLVSDNDKNNVTSANIPASTTTITGGDDNNSMDIWKCNCFSGQQFLPKSIFGNMEAVLKMGTGECYHK